MGKVLVVFGSQSDEPVFAPLMEKLKDAGIEARLEVCSAHREPDRLQKILDESKEKIVVAGAGLSAALPGFVASHCDKLVLGIPVKANYSGLDSLLSIHQMPKGFGVLGVGVEALEEVVNGIGKMLKPVEKVVVIKPVDGEEALKRFGACTEKLQELGVDFVEQEHDKYEEDNVLYIDFIELDRVQAVGDEGKLVVFVPVKKDSKEKDALQLLLLTKTGLWVGLGRGENAAIAAEKIRGF